MPEVHNELAVPVATPLTIASDDARSGTVHSTGHAAEPNSLGGSLDALVNTLSARERGDLLLALSEHASALRLVWEAHQRGVIALPAALAARVAALTDTMPGYLRGVSRTGAMPSAVITAS